MATSLIRPPPGFSNYENPMSLPPRSHSFSGGHARPLLSPPATSEHTNHSPAQQDSPFPGDTRDAPRAPQRHGSLQLPSLAALASIASDQVRASPAPHGPLPTSMSYATAAPGQSPGGALPAGPPICQNCQTMTTPLWRRDEMGSVLCNACGLFLKLHSRARPISLKTDVIKSRNRVKALGASGQKKKFPGQGLAAAHPDVASQPQSTHPHYQGLHRRASQQHDSLSRAATPSLYPPHPTAPNIAPQHMFDNSTGDSQNSHSYTNSPQINRPHSPSPLAHSNAHDSSSYPQLSYEEILAQNNRLKTRVSELEVINDLFQGRVAELEAALAQMQRAGSAPAEAATTANDGRKRDAERVAEESSAATSGEAFDTASQAAGEAARRSKKMRMSDLLDDEPRPSTPATSSADRPGD